MCQWRLRFKWKKTERKIQKFGTEGKQSCPDEGCVADKVDKLPNYYRNSLWNWEFRILKGMGGKPQRAALALARTLPASRGCVPASLNSGKYVGQLLRGSRSTATCARTMSGLSSFRRKNALWLRAGRCSRRKRQRLKPNSWLCRSRRTSCLFL
jgi:hypothetical protein